MKKQNWTIEFIQYIGKLNNEHIRRILKKDLEEVRKEKECKLTVEELKQKYSSAIQERSFNIVR